MPLAEAGPPPGRRWNPWDIAVFPVVDTARIGAPQCTGMEIMTAQGSTRRQPSWSVRTGEPAYPLGPHFACPRQGPGEGVAPPPLRFPPEAPRSGRPQHASS